MRKILTISVVVLGISSVMSQLVVMREFLAVFGGNELTFGIILGNWTLLTGIGSYVGKRLPQKVTVLIWSQMGIGVLPVVQLSLLRATKNLLFVQGEVANVSELFVWSFVLLAPFCLLIGSFFTLACGFLSQRRASDIGKVYVMDGLGTVVGGAFFSFVFIYIFDQVQISYSILVLNVGLSFLVSLSVRSRLLYGCVGIFCLFGVISFYDLNGMTIQQLYKGQNVVYEKSSLYGHIVVCEKAGQLTVFEDNVPLFSTGDIIAQEETVHYAMAQRDTPQRVLLIGGGASGTIEEALKYEVAVDYVEVDPDILRVGETYTDNVRGALIYEMDGRQYVKETEMHYDVVILDVPDPDCAQLNRFYTVEFFGEVRNILEKDGVFSLKLSASPNYVGLPTRELYSSVYKALKSVFSHVIVIPGESTFFLASEGELTYRIAERIEEKAIPTEYVNTFYLSGTLTEDRISMVSQSVTEDVHANADFKPVAYYYYLVYWMSQFRSSFWGFLAGFIIVVVLLILWIAPHPVPFAVFTTGLAGTALEIVLVLGFQILYGYVYSQVGVLITCFMVGLVIGAFHVNKKLEKYSLRSLIVLEFLLFVFSVGLGVFLPCMVKAAFPLVTGVLGILVGAEFPVASSLYYEDVRVTAATLYSVDLLGGCMGALLASTVLIPLLGIPVVCTLVGVINAISGLILLKKDRGKEK